MDEVLDYDPTRGMTHYIQKPLKVNVCVHFTPMSEWSSLYDIEYESLQSGAALIALTTFFTMGLVVPESSL